MTRSRAVATVPAGLLAMLLVVSTLYDGAYDVRHWAPVALFALVLLAALVLRGGARPLSAPLVVAVAAIWALCGWSFLSVAWADSVELALEGAARTAFYAALVTVALVAVPGAREMRAVGSILIGGIVAVAGLTLARMHLDGAEVFIAGRPDSPTGYRNATACLFAAAFWPLIGTAVTRGRNPTFRAACFAAAVLCLGLAFLTQSRGVVVGLAAGGLVALVLSTERIRRSFLALVAVGGLLVLSAPLLVAYRNFEHGGGPVTEADIATVTGALTFLVVDAFIVGLLLALLDGGLRASARNLARARRVAIVGLAVGAVGLFAGGMVAAGDPLDYAEAKWGEFQAFEDKSAEFSRLLTTGGERYDIWRVAVAEFTANPLLGVGEASYPFDYYAERQTDRNLDDPHSLPLALLAELGAVGLLLLLAFLAALAVALIRGVRWERLKSWGPPGELVYMRHAIGGLAAAGAVVLGHALVDWIWQVPAVTGLGLYALALAAGIAAPGRAAVREPAPEGVWGREGAQPTAARHDPGAVAAVRVRLGRIYAAAGSAPRRGVAATGLVGAALVAAVLFVGDYYVREARTAETPEAALDAARAAEVIAPWAVTPRHLEAGALEALGDVPGARAELDEALALEPRNWATLGLLGDLEMRAGNDDRARRLYRRALALNPLDVGLRELASQARRRAAAGGPRGS